MREPLPPFIPMQPKGVMYAVCPKNKAARPDDEPMGGPQPDRTTSEERPCSTIERYISFGSSSSSFRNPQNEAYGGPFGPDPFISMG